MVFSSLAVLGVDQKYEVLFLCCQPVQDLCSDAAGFFCLSQEFLIFLPPEISGQISFAVKYVISVFDSLIPDDIGLFLFPIIISPP